GCSLLFSEAAGQTGSEQDPEPKRSLAVEGALVQALPEHPKRDFIFCLSNAHGEVFCFQAESQIELENWVTAVHSACAWALAGRSCRGGRGASGSGIGVDPAQALTSEVRDLEHRIDLDEKMRKMAELQLLTVSEPKSRKAILAQVSQWERNLERYSVDAFRLRCYLASLQGREPPNPKLVLAYVSRPVKHAMHRLGMFSASSFHALVCAREETGFRKRTFSRGLSKKKSVFASLRGLDGSGKKPGKERPRASQVSEKLHLRAVCVCDVIRHGSAYIYTYVHKQCNGGVGLGITPDCTVSSIEPLQCTILLMSPTHLRLSIRNVDESPRKCGPSPDTHWSLPTRTEILKEPNSSSVQGSPCMNVCTLIFGIFFAVINRAHATGPFVARLHLHIIADAVSDASTVMAIQRRLVGEMSKENMFESKFLEKALILNLNSPPPPPAVSSCDSWNKSERRRRGERSLPPPPPPYIWQFVEELNSNVVSLSPIDAAVCQDLKTNLRACGVRGTLEQISNYISHARRSVFRVLALELSNNLNKGSGVTSAMEPAEVAARPLSRQLTEADKLRKVILELVETERSYVKDLCTLQEIYVEPLQKEAFLSPDQLEALFGTLRELVIFQKEFLQTLEQGLSLAPDFETLEQPAHFRRVLFSLGGSFLYYSDHFKLYSAYCASHPKAQKLLETAKRDPAFGAFLDERNPRRQHSSTLESYLIKPIQRVLKYPLLLRELVSLTDADSEENYHLTEALRAMNKVASHINEMQKVYEEYGAVFDQLVVEQTGAHKEVTELSMGDLVMNAPVLWLNPHPAAVSRSKKWPEAHLFVFKKAVVLICKDHSKHKKKPCTVSCVPGSQEEPDPFKFKYMIPQTSLQVRTGTDTDSEAGAEWELVHVKSETEGRPETVFRVCCSDAEWRERMVRVVRAVLREGSRQRL
uniref:TIAM Rac1 associated GEF 2b n=1 Tax=Petromyzon marinus TaxID=7757 RepID=S4RNZ5_PETMA